MGELQEDSLLFSLQGLMDHEREREADEQRVREQRAAEERATREEQLRAERERAEQARQREAAHQKEQQRREREEQVHLEALKQGVMERARADAERKAHAELMKVRETHDANMRQLTQRSASRVVPWAIATFVAPLAVAAGAALAYFQVVEPQHKRELTAYRLEAALEKSRADEATAGLEATRDNQVRLERQVNKLREKLRELPKQEAPSPPEHSVAPPATSPPASEPTETSEDPPEPNPGVCGDPNDPLNGCLPSP